MTSPGLAKGTAYLVLKKQKDAVGFQILKAQGSPVFGWTSAPLWQRAQQSAAWHGLSDCGPFVQPCAPRPVHPVLRCGVVPGGGSRASKPSYQLQVRGAAGAAGASSLLAANAGGIVANTGLMSARTNKRLRGFMAAERGESEPEPERLPGSASAAGC